MLRIREAESTQTMGDLRQKIAELEIQVKYPLTINFKFYFIFSP
jgi:hypothetical protein